MVPRRSSPSAVIPVPKVVVTDCDFGPPFSLEEAELRAVGAELSVANSTNEDALIAAAAAADGLLVQYARITPRLMDAMPRCRVISRYGIGMDMIDLAGAQARGIICCNVPVFCVSEVADHVLALLLNLARHVTRLDSSVREGVWNVREVAPGCERLDGQTLGLIGLGKIAQAVAVRARAFGMRVIAHSPRAPESVFRNAEVTPVELDDLLRTADFVSIHTPLRAQTWHLIGSAELGRMKSAAFLINSARGPVVDTDALAQALETGAIAGAALDVLEQEPMPKDSPLLSLPNLIITPHAAFYSKTSLTILRSETAAEVARVLSGQPPRSPVVPD